MYNLNYTYLSDLDIDTSRSARDVSASTVFAAIDDNDYTVPLTSITNRFVEWFFTASNPNIPNLNITLLDANIMNGERTQGDAIKTYGELTAYLETILTAISANMTTKLNATINTLSTDNITPTGSVAINKSAPSNTDWAEVDKPEFLYEASVPDEVGEIFQRPAGGAGEALSDIVITHDGGIPHHTHEVKLTPSQKKVNAEITDSDSGLGRITYANKRVVVKTEHLPAAKRNSPIAQGGDGWNGESSQFIADVKGITEAYKRILTVTAAGSDIGSANRQQIAPNVHELTDAKLFVKV